MQRLGQNKIPTWVKKMYWVRSSVRIIFISLDCSHWWHVNKFCVNVVCKHLSSCMWRHFCDVFSVTFKFLHHKSWCNYVIRTKSQKVLPNFGFVWKGGIDHIVMTMSCRDQLFFSHRLLSFLYPWIFSPKSKCGGKCNLTF